MTDLLLRLVAEDAASGAFDSVSGAVKKATAIIYDFSKESVKAFAEAERAQKQLARAAGENTAAFEDQAEVLSQKLAIEDESIKQLQALALTYSTLPSQVGPAIEAVENWSVVTGKDAKGAMLELIKAVEAGTGELDRGRLQFEVTGDSARDMANAIEALNAKFGGAAAADADTLEGRMRQASIASGELKEAWGGLLATIESKLGILDRAANYLRGITAAGSALLNRDVGAAAGLFVASNMALTGDTVSIGTGAGGGPGVVDPARRGAIEVTADVGEIARAKGGGGKDSWGWGPFGDPEKSFEGWQAEYQQYQAQKEAELNEAALREASAATQRFLDEMKAEEKHDAAVLDSKRKLADMELDIEVDKHKRIDAELEKANAAHQRVFDHQVEQWKQAGDRMGAALVDAIGAQLLRMAEGGDTDPAVMAGDVVATILGIAGFAIGTYFGAPQVGGAIGGLAGGLARAGIVGAWGRKKKHDGGPLERYHTGGVLGLGPDEVPFIGQQGEHILSRRDVANMGGHAGVEAAKRGGGGRSMVVNISAIDAQSFLDSFGKDAGRGFFDAIRVGRGDLVPLFTGS